MSTVTGATREVNPGRLLRCLLLVAIVAGVFFRFYQLDHKVFWDDEVYAAVRILGYSEAEVDRRANRATDAAGLNEILHPPRSVRTQSVSATIAGLAQEEPQHAPAYYVFEHYWTQFFGASVAAMRSLSAVAGLAALPCMFWLCSELYGSRVAAWLGVTLFALAPVEVLYSQEAREYSLWTVTLLILCAAFLRATRLQTWPAWSLYALSLGLSLYVYPLSALLAFGHLLFLAVERKRRPRAYVAPLAASLAGFGLFSPWLWVMFENRTQVGRSMATIFAPKSSALGIARTFLGMLRFDFLDFNITHAASINVVLSILPIVLVFYALYVLYRRTPLRTWSFVAIVLAATVAPLVVPDLLLSGQRTANTRYFMPLYAFIDVALAGLFVDKEAFAPAAARRLLWTAAFIAVLVCRATSCVVSSQADTWWNKLDEKSIAVARAIDATTDPVLLSDNYAGYALSLANYLDPKTRVQLWPRCYLCSVNGLGSADARLVRRDGDSAVFALGPSPALQALLAATARLRYRCIDVRSDCASSLSLW